MATMLLVLSAMCLLSTFAWTASAPVAAPVGATAAVASSLLSVPPGPLFVPVVIATALVAAIGLATAVGLLHPPAPQHH